VEDRLSKDVNGHVSESITYDEMAALLEISPATVKYHLTTAYRQLRVRGAVGAAAAWRAHMDPDPDIARLVWPLLNPDAIEEEGSGW